MTSWKTTIGGALSSFGKAMMGVGIVPQLGTGEANTTLQVIAIVGFVCDCAGGFFGHLYAADEAKVIHMLKQVGTDTSVLEKKK